MATCAGQIGKPTDERCDLRIAQTLRQVNDSRISMAARQLSWGH